MMATGSREILPYNGRMHHAYLSEGPVALLPALARDARDRFGFKESLDPDVFAESFERFGVEDARALIARASLKTISGRALFAIGISSATTEAQHALLKLFEEPQEGTIFVLLSPHGILLSTLRSRMLEYPSEIKLSEAGSLTSEAAKFLKLNKKSRSDFVVKMLKNEEGAKERVRGFVNALEEYLAVRLRKSNSDEVREGLEDIARVRDYLRDRSPSLKMLLEHLALALPEL